jgi:S-DNA-T family DNA segregation ATPase FtsK/SpoIIIE
MAPLTAEIGRDDSYQPVSLDLRDHVWCGGDIGSGKTMFLRRAAYDVHSRFSPAEVQFLVADSAGGGLADLARLPHTAQYVPDQEVPNARRLAALIGDEIRRRLRLAAVGQLGGTPHLVVLADQPRIAITEVGELGDSLRWLVAQGSRVRMSLVITDRFADDSGLLGELRAQITTRVSLKFFSAGGESSTLGVPVEPLAAMPGQAYVYTGAGRPRRSRVDAVSPAEVRDSRFRARWPGIRAVPLQPPLQTLTDDELRYIAEAQQQSATIPLGIVESSSDAVVNLDFIRSPHFVVLGGPRSGRSTVLRTVVRGLARRYTKDECVLMLFGHELHGVAHDDYVLTSLPGFVIPEDVSKDVEASLRKRATSTNGWKGPRLFLVIDDFDRFQGEHDLLWTLQDLIGVGGDIGMHFIVAGTDALTARPHVGGLGFPVLRLDDSAVPGSGTGDLPPIPQPGLGTLTMAPGDEVRVQLPWFQRP